MQIHPTDELLHRLAEALPDSLLRRALEHSVDCDRCLDRMRRILGGRQAQPARVLPWPHSIYGPILDRVVARAQRAGLPLRRAQAEAPILLGTLLALPAERRSEMLAGDPRFHSWPLADLVLDRSHETSFEDPTRGEELADLGMAVIETLVGGDVGEPLLNDLRARAQAALANCRRMQSDHRRAEDALAAARRALSAGTGDPLERARILDLEASLRKEQRRFDEAARLLRRAIAAYRSADETRRAGRAQIKLSSLYRLAGRPDDAVAVLREAVRDLRSAADHRLHLCAAHNLAVVLTESGQYLEAHRIFHDAATLYQRFDDTWTERRRLWLEGRIHLGVGHLDAAARCLEQARVGFLEQEIVYDAALVSLDLAEVYAAQGRTAELRRLGREMFPVFEARGIHREAKRALDLFRRASEVDLVSTGLVRRLVAYLRRARHDPGIEFDV